MIVAAYHMMMVIGNAMIYRTRWVKFNSKKRLPTKPQTSEAVLAAMHLCDGQDHPSLLGIGPHVPVRIWDMRVLVVGMHGTILIPPRGHQRCN